VGLAVEKLMKYENKVKNGVSKNFERETMKAGGKLSFYHSKYTIETCRCWQLI
jgi:hypothetical protein